MDKLGRYRQIIKNALCHYAELSNRHPDPDRETEVIFDDERDHYLLVSTGWRGKERVRYTTVYVRIRGGKFWIEEDGLEEGIATDLLEADVPNEDIVLAFHHPRMRQFSEFAVA